MIAAVKTQEATTKPAWHRDFLPMLPSIRRQARFAFRGLPPERREEMVAAVVAGCVAGYVRLVERGKQDVAYPSALAHFAIKAVRCGRGLGDRQCMRELLSHYGQFRQQFQLVERLDQFDQQAGAWRAALIEDRRAGPAATAAARIDFSQWLDRLSDRLRQVALVLAAGESTTAAAEQFAVTPGRISQLRRWLQRSWERYQGVTQNHEQPQPDVA